MVIHLILSAAFAAAVPHGPRLGHALAADRLAKAQRALANKQMAEIKRMMARNEADRAERDADRAEREQGQARAAAADAAWMADYRRRALAERERVRLNGGPDTRTAQLRAIERRVDADEEAITTLETQIKTLAAICEEHAKLAAEAGAERKAADAAFAAYELRNPGWDKDADKLEAGSRLRTATFFARGKDEAITETSKYSRSRADELRLRAALCRAEVAVLTEAARRVRERDAARPAPATPGSDK